MCDRLAVMDDGQVEQVGTPEEVYEQPATAYVADFLGVANLLDADAPAAPAQGLHVASMASFDRRAAASASGQCGW